MEIQINFFDDICHNNLPFKPNHHLPRQLRPDSIYYFICGRNMPLIYDTSYQLNTDSLIKINAMAYFRPNSDYIFGNDFR
jgi:hypothetical protein